MQTKKRLAAMIACAITAIVLFAAIASATGERISLEGYLTIPEGIDGVQLAGDYQRDATNALVIAFEEARVTYDDSALPVTGKISFERKDGRCKASGIVRHKPFTSYIDTGYSLSCSLAARKAARLVISDFHREIEYYFE